MSESRDTFVVVSKFGPADLFQILKKTTEHNKHQSSNPSFDFDWMKRSISLTSKSSECCEEMLETVITQVNKKAGTGMLLPGDARKNDDGTTTIPIGVLIQTPDIYIEMILGTLHELGITGASADEEENRFSVPNTSVSRMLNYRMVLESFPLPDYISIKEVN